MNARQLLFMYLQIILTIIVILISNKSSDSFKEFLIQIPIRMLIYQIFVIVVYLIIGELLKLGVMK